MTDLGFFAGLLRGESRIAAFHEAIGRVVRPGDRVLDLGCGLGTFAFFAARAGAERVWAVDRDAVVHVAASLAAANGLAERVTCLRGDAAALELPAPVDVLIFEDFPATLLDARTHALLGRVHEALMAGRGRMIPGAARLAVGAVGARPGRPDVHAVPEGTGAFALDWTPLRALLANHPTGTFLAPSDLLAPPVRGAPFSLHPLPSPDALRVEGAWRVGAAGAVHALALWFELEVGPGIWLSNEPRERAEPWGQVLLPLHPPLEAPAHARLAVQVRREALSTGAPGWLVWEASCAGEVRNGHEFGGLALGPENLPAGAAGAGGTPRHETGTSEEAG